MMGEITGALAGGVGVGDDIGFTAMPGGDDEIGGGARRVGDRSIGGCGGEEFGEFGAIHSIHDLLS